MDTETLGVDEEYGCLSFDRFILGRWDHSKPRTGDQQQWNGFVRKWLALTPRERHPYHEFAAQRPQPNASVPIAEQYDRILVPFQTVRERKLSTWMCSPTWLRTCYKSDLAEQYAHLAPKGEQYVIVLEHQILDDEAIYGRYAADWSQFLLRVPGLTDSVSYTGDADLANIDIPEDDLEDPEEEYKQILYDATRATATIMFLVDEEAVSGGFIKILWLDCHGNCVWDNKIQPQSMLVFAGVLYGGAELPELVDRFDSIEEQTHPAYERGFDFRL